MLGHGHSGPPRPLCPQSQEVASVTEAPRSARAADGSLGLTLGRGPAPSQKESTPDVVSVGCWVARPPLQSRTSPKGLPALELPGVG